MKCPNCRFENPENMKFCGECGANLERICPKCRFSNPPQFKFCGECGQKLENQVVEKVSETERRVPEAEGERKHVTVLFSDLTGYTTMSEKLDPEEVKEITVRMFDEISKIVSKYDGFIEKYAGDAVMALFGANQSHEDDPVRAIKAAHEIHGLVEAMSPQYEDTVGQPFRMHTGINTGLVVTGELNLSKGVHGVAGDAVNVASRLSSIAKPGEILIGPDTYSQAEGFFNFESLEPAVVKGKAKPIPIYKYVSSIEQPRKIHRLHGLRAELIGRKAEMAQLSEAVNNLAGGAGIGLLHYRHCRYRKKQANRGIQNDFEY